MAGRFLFAAFFIIVGIVIGWTLSSKNYAFPESYPPQVGIGGGPNIPVSSNTKSADFRVDTQSLFREYSVLSSGLVQTIASGENEKPIFTKLDENGRRFYGIVASVYGAETADKLSSLWQGHLKLFSDYANATQENNEEKKSRARDDLVKISREFEKIFEEVNNVSADRIGNYMLVHGERIFQISDAAAKGESADIVEFSNMAREEMGNFADYFAEIIIAEKPSLFM